MALILLRHTAPRVAAGTCYGRTDLGLADTFEHDAARVLASLPPVFNIVTSPLRRCLQLAEKIATVRGLSLDVEPGLVEMDFGSWEGKPWSDIPREELDLWASDFLHGRPHGGESVAMLRQRVRAALAKIEVQSDPVLVVTHAGVIRAALAKGDTADHFNTQIAFGAFVSIAPGETL